jgi:hypothetical protein
MRTSGGIPVRLLAVRLVPWSGNFLSDRLGPKATQDGAKVTMITARATSLIAAKLTVH